MKKYLLFVLALSLILGSSLLAQDPTSATPTPEQIQAMEQAQRVNETTITPSVTTELTVLAGLALLPFAIMMLTSYIKMVIVLSLLRNALGVQNSPPNQILNGIALLMSIYVMYPTCLAMYNAAGDYVKTAAPVTLISGPTATYMINVANKAKEPMRDFLQRNTLGKHIQGFYQLAYKSFPEDFRKTLKPTDFIVLIPSFITTQLKAAFEIGVLIYLPFFVIDLVVSNILLAMGMMMLSPLTISLPLKLLLIVMVDGWTLIIQGLVLSFR
ncbi:MAG: type III secretion system export apparatus subunit SctR [Chlamydiota bacterium]